MEKEESGNPILVRSGFSKTGSDYYEYTEAQHISSQIIGGNTEICSLDPVAPLFGFDGVDLRFSPTVAPHRLRQ
jgi:hypothetical protein